MLKRTVALAAVLGLSAAGLLVAGPVATATTKPSVRVACTDGVNPTQLPGPTTKRSVPGPVGSVVELRYSSNHCAWGRVRNVACGFDCGDAVWVDRAVNRTEANNGRWEGLLGWSLVNPGEKSQFSLAYNDNGPIMRACAQIYGGAGREIRCTDWY
ncbi:hypothetical protein [Lentzea terrae]|uniref:hypothetical protein n=1 Tax=Lentzea terrae TaxID=2200761 RepID=UPI0013007108|nr:hypothetical protein [Lentzea terrae]